MAMVKEADALPGRDEAMKISDTHFVLKNPMQEPTRDDQEEATFATGCFWGTEKTFWQLPGVYTTAVGYINGFTKNPTYKEVCSGRTGHTEAVRVVYDPSVISYADLLKAFWESHDPTQGMGQGGDRGTQYRSGLYYTTETQQVLAEASKKAYNEALAKSRGDGSPAITTEVVAAPTFYFAEDYHQQYIDKPGNRKYCGAQPTGVDLPPPSSWGLPADVLAAGKQNETIWGKSFSSCPL
eukprot:m.479279 g.479279  ORF g.479279 m.479279 type:complete len:239 (-) comp21391_c0_seq1:15-731(-)